MSIIFFIVVIIIIIIYFYNTKEKFRNKYMNLIEPDVKYYDIQNKFNPSIQMNVLNNELNDISNQYERTYNIKESNNNLILQNPQEINDDDNYIKNNLRLNNINKFSDFQTGVVNQNSNMFETEVDKFAQLRTGETFDISQYGKTIWEAYDNIMSNPFSKYQTTTNPLDIMGSNTNTFNNNYTKLDSKNYRVDNLIQ